MLHKGWQSLEVLDGLKKYIFDIIWYFFCREYTTK